MYPCVTHIKAVTDIQRSILKKNYQLIKINYWHLLDYLNFAQWVPMLLKQKLSAVVFLRINTCRFSKYGKKPRQSSE